MWPVAILVVVAIYLHGVNGPFLFDDFANLDALGAHGGVNDWQSLWLYLSQGDAGPTGRPVSLLSFLIDDNSWPSSPESFKYTNILIHALNGCLVFWLQLLLLQQSPRQNFREKHFYIALVASLLWLLHPLFTSTVLYVVQRMAMLSATFVLAGLLSHILFRSLIESRPKAAYAGMTISLGFWGALSVLSKENGVLLPALILVLECSGFRANDKLSRAWIISFLVVPTIIILGYLLSIPLKQGFFVEWPSRGFSPFERLITESRILWDYFFRLYAFRVEGSGLFHDNYAVSRSLVDPLVTLPAIIGILLLGYLCVIQRKRWPLLSLALSFYFVGHLIESTTVSLELYFEHRNYLPAIFLFLPVAAGLQWLTGWIKPVTTGLVLLTVTFLLLNRVNLWSDSVSLASSWAKEAPHSVRAQRSAAIALTQAGRVESALDVLNQAFEKHAEEHSILMHRMLLKCSLGQNIAQDKVLLLEISRHAPFNPKLTNMIDVFLSASKGNGCQSLNPEYSKEWISALMTNPVARSSGGFRHQLYFFRGVIRSYEKDGDGAKSDFVHAIKLRPRVGVFLQSAAVLATDGNCRSALNLISELEDPLIHSGNNFNKDYYQSELKILTAKIQDSCKLDIQ